MTKKKKSRSDEGKERKLLNEKDTESWN